MAETIETPNGSATLVRRGGRSPSASLMAGHRRLASTWKTGSGKFRVTVYEYAGHCEPDFDTHADAEAWLRDNATRLLRAHVLNQELAAGVTALVHGDREKYPDNAQHLSNLDLLTLLERVASGDPRTTRALRAALQHRDVLLRAHPARGEEVARG